MDSEEKKYKSYKDLNERSIEEWARELDECPKRELTSEESEIFLEAGIVENTLETSLDFEEKIKGWNGVNLLHKRLLVHDFTMSRATQICCGILITSPGEMVMMANYIQYRCHRHQIKHVTIRTLCEKIMPMGWFDKETLSRFWDKQKYITVSNGLANILDRPDCAYSIRVKHLE